MPLLHQKKPKPTTPPTGMDSPLQDVLSEKDSVECYSDCGYPTLPRPKVILSLRHSDSGWNPQQASLLQTVPVRILNSKEQFKPVERGRSFSLDTAIIEQRRLNGTALQASLTTNKDIESKHRSTHNENHRPHTDSLVVPKPRVVRSKSLFAPHTKPYNSKPIIHPVSSSPLLINSREQSPLTTAVQHNQRDTTEMSTNHSRVFSRKASAESNTTVSGSQNKTKKPRKPSRSLTFSFGVGSDKKRKSLGFLGSKPRRQSDEGNLLSVRNTVSPSSPILMSKRKSHTLPGMATSSSVSDLQQHSILEERDSCGSSGAWGQAQVYPRQDNGAALLKNHFGSCRDFHSVDETERVKNRPRPALYIPSRGDTNSPTLDYSPVYTPTSGLSSRQDSLESLALSMRSEPPPRFTYSNPPSRSQSPNMKGSGFKDDLMVPRSRERKLSDPVPSNPDLDGQSGISDSPPSATASPRGSLLRKRNTFCVRQTRLTHKPGWHEMRHHVVRFLLETEQSYVQSLRTIIKVYMEPLHRPQAAALIEPSLAKDIFHQIPEVCRLHEKFLDQVVARVEGWNSDSKIGDVFVNTFSKCQLMDIYSKFIGNFMRAKTAIEIAKQARPVFARFLEQRAKDSKGRFTLDDLLIKPVQRIPRYVLFIKDLLKHTSVSHPDHAPLQQALGELTALAERVNASERERGRLEEQKELITAVEGLAHLIKPQSRFIRYDMVTEIKGNVQKRDRFLILFSDMIVCACARRKSTGFIRGSLLNLNSVFSDALKHTVKWYAPLTEVSRAQLQAPTFDKRRQNTVEKMLDNLTKDESTLQKMAELSGSLHTPHQLINSTLKNALSDIREKIVEKKSELDNLPLESGRIDLISYSNPSPSQYALVFPSQRIRNTWEVEFIAAKSKADKQAPPNSNIAPPTSPAPVSTPNHLSNELKFLHPLLLQSGRVGTELTCGAIGLPVDCESPSCLWVCCSDGYGGQVSILDLLPSTPSHALANITVCDARITNIAAIPTNTSHTPTASSLVSLPPTISVDSFVSSSASISSSDSDTHTGNTNSCSEGASNLDEPICILGDSISNLEDSLSNLDIPVNDPATGQNGNVINTKEGTTADTSFNESRFKRVRSNSAPPFPDPVLANGPHSSQMETTHSTVDDMSSMSATKIYSPLTLRPANLEWEGLGDEDCGHCMWLGTGEGRIYVYSPGNNLRSRSQRQCVKLSSSISCLRYHEGTVYVGLANGTLAIFDASRDPGSGPVRHMSVSGEPVVACVPLMIGVGVCSGGTLYQVSTDKQSVTPLATLPSGQVIQDAVSVKGGVWVSVQAAPTLHLLHVPSGILLTTIDCTCTVMNLLQGYNPIIRQHKSSSLHLTHLLPTPTHLIVGTSAGVVITIPLSPIPPTLEPHPLTHPPSPASLPRGHVGPIHFLTSIKKGTSTLIFTGGNGCEDFVTMTTSQEVPETSCCLLVWSLG